MDVGQLFVFILKGLRSGTIEGGKCTCLCMEEERKKGKAESRKDR